jgi:hypothetical protein
MLWFVDETWQNIGSHEVGALGAVAIPAASYNAFCREVYAIKARVLGAAELTDSEFKGQHVFARAAFKRQRLHGDSYWLSAGDGLFAALKKYGASCFVIWTTNPALLTLRNPHSTALGKPYKQLLFDMRAFMQREATGLLGSISFDQRGYREDEATARAISNFLIRTSHVSKGDRWDRYFLTIPSFTASSISPGLQAADLVSYLGAHRCDSSVRPELAPYQTVLNDLRYEYFRGRRRQRVRCIRKVS